MELVRLDKMLADQGTYSRKEARGLIRAGAVFVNGRAVFSPEHKVAEGDEIVAEGKPLLVQRFVYLMLNKPAGVLCATRDKFTPTVLDLVPEQWQRRGIFPAGRLDKDTEGFVLITNDGAFAHRLLSPRSHVPKTYHARLDRPMRPEMPEAFAQGLELDEGDVCSPASIRVLEEGENPLVEIIIHEGMYHQIKRMVAKFSLKVLFLKRMKMGNLALDPALKPGECREILHKEVEGIW